jgi:metal-responsive CopG/Arc/MetJ family transcriptional regulator
MKRRESKEDKSGAVKRSISAPNDLWAAADAVCAAKKIENFSEYIRGLMRHDLETSKKAA